MLPCAGIERKERETVVVNPPPNLRRVPPVKEHIIGGYESRTERCIENMRRSAECHRAIRLCAGRQRGVPAIANCEIACQEIRDRNSRGLEKSHRIGLLRRMRVGEFGIGLNKTVHRKITGYYRLGELRRDVV